MQRFILAFVPLVMLPAICKAQAYDVPERGEPGDEAIQGLLSRTAIDLDRRFPFGDRSSEPDIEPVSRWVQSPSTSFQDVQTAGDWQARRDALKKQYLFMLGLDPLPPAGDLKATVTGTYEGDGFLVEMLHYQSIPGLYVTANLYRPANLAAGERLPAILYVCGHSGMGKNGNKTAFQSHGIWFARHGYVCLVLDTLQLGEIPGIHHGTYREGRWWWHARGYTPAGVECWNGIRGLDYLCSRPDVDPDRLGVTGISGGGAATFWIAAADDRVKAAAPVSGMADLQSYVSNRVINGHCDCMFFYNAYQWPWTGIASLIAPRPLLFVNSDADPIFPMDANERVIARLERFYSLFGAGDKLDAVVSIGGHAYREDIRRAVYAFFNRHLKQDASPVLDAEVDAVAESNPTRPYPIEPERLRVFASEDQLPKDALNQTIDEHFVPRARLELPQSDAFPSWRDGLLSRLRSACFPTANSRPVVEDRAPSSVPPILGKNLRALDGFPLAIEIARSPGEGIAPKRIVLLIAHVSDREDDLAQVADLLQPTDLVYRLHPRGQGPTRWSEKSPPNYVARSHALLGTTVDTMRVLDVLDAGRLLKQSHSSSLPLAVAGREASGILAGYAALLDPGISEVLIAAPPDSHMDPNAPQFLNVLRVLDIPDALGMIAPRPLSLLGGSDALRERLFALYTLSGAPNALRLSPFPGKTSD